MILWESHRAETHTYTHTHILIYTHANMHTHMHARAAGCPPPSSSAPMSASLLPQAPQIADAAGASAADRFMYR